MEVHVFEPVDEIPGDADIVTMGRQVLQSEGDREEGGGEESQEKTMRWWMVGTHRAAVSQSVQG